MTKPPFFRSLCAALLFLSSSCISVAATPPTVDQLQASFNFLINSEQTGGAVYLGTAGALNGNRLPLSYFDTASYWGNYVCRLAGNDCQVTDIYNPSNYTLTPNPNATDPHSGQLQVERVDVHNGTDIYDAATWQIGVELGEVINRFTADNYSQLANNENKLLQLGYDGNFNGSPLENANRAVSKGDTFVYNGHDINQSAAKQAYYFRMVTRDWLSTDPFFNSTFATYITATNLPSNPVYYAGVISWLDWKPITGENAWAFLIGPLQAANIHYIDSGKQTFVPFNDLAVQNALRILPTFADMQSAIGAIDYVPSGTLGNQGSVAVNPHTVSVENNFSLYAGLNVLKGTLSDELTNETDLSDANKASIKSALNTIDVMIHGGQVTGDDSTRGLLSFFRCQAWSQNEFIQGGIANDPKQKSNWIPNLEPKAVDVNTWGIAALGAKQIDQWFGFGAAFADWQQVKSWGGYGKGKTLWGVGYSDQDGNGQTSTGDYRQGIMSTEWTAGAIIAVQNMINYYATIPASSAHYAQAQQDLDTLKSDHLSMLHFVQLLRIGQYAQADFPGTPANYTSLLSKEQYQPYLYASKRYMIPFGWYANPLPSSSSTAWMIMAADQFNPLQYDNHTVLHK